MSYEDNIPEFALRPVVSRSKQIYSSSKLRSVSPVTIGSISFTK